LPVTELKTVVKQSLDSGLNFEELSKKYPLVESKEE